MGSSKSLVEEFKSCMMRKFEMTDLGLLHYFLGLEVKQSPDGIFISQRKYATDLLKRFNLLNCKSMHTPINVNEKLVAHDGTSMANARFFRSMVGGLNYLLHIRPDITHSVSVISRFMHNPTQQHMGAAKRILRYVAGSVDFGIWYGKSSSFRLFGYSDSDWAGCSEERKSTSGYIFSLGPGAVSWSTKKQNVVALSSSEAEYIAVTAAACQCVWLRRLLVDFLQVQDGVTDIFVITKQQLA
ncbi:secreted RxLR effector protein 161-like [Beta vulgaris subsp. vulgaris]|uniref:secreted RxLR effector protein 161-like n=1 Tax=Beta vulgaris subsp. vulgaris TaxID=3555 RepID=UPI0020369494|nr:secreted RxLR effector protein 161-like [Beta vulgaris subsp. vulgaris]